jgi:hypothetical protein
MATLLLTAERRLRRPQRATWARGVKTMEFQPLAFIARLAALMPPPKFPMLRYLGVIGDGREAGRRPLPATRASGRASYRTHPERHRSGPSRQSVPGA